MTGSGSPCGACKFLRRKCVKGCVFAPYFSHEHGPSNFAAIHKVFGASNVSKLLTQIPVSDRSEAAATLSYEAQARVQDPIYGCVSHIFALQQQVVNLQSQLASLKEQAAECIINNSTITANPNDLHKFRAESHSSPHNFHSPWQSLQNQVTMPQFDAILNSSTQNPYYSGGSIDSSPSVKHENPIFGEQNLTYGNLDSAAGELCNKQWPFQDVGDELQSVAFGHLHLS